jgi:uncharacterized membrane protein
MRARASTIVPGGPAEAEALWSEAARWPSWIDGFGHLASVQGTWPDPGAVLTWDSKPGGRGRVRERIVSRVPGAEQVAEVEDQRLEGTQTVHFEARGDRTVIGVAIDYRLKERTFLTPAVDLLFIRRALAASLQRSLARFAVERTADAETA